MKTRRTGLAAAWLAAALPLAAGAQAMQGVSKTEVVVGTIQDLSGLSQELPWNSSSC
ncbi:hypothetical protein QTH89_03900 [Variovorax sp. J22G21]|uniref:hypothetical protein n=1 Tax=Variovorax fucosicus TaxID=3053517 RepID=UPI002578A336|nr:MULTISPECIES: hypothetical protein [unclassified Variovorax]MDM0041285.1 hypothetical protein [Variovorax sp. J22R193]MDM0060342.1 hypothetical protein [Variovorax sp. J22G21]